MNQSKGSTSSTIHIPDNRIDIWCAFLPPEWNDDLFQIYQNILTAEESERCARFRFERDRRLFLLTRALVRDVLSRYVGGEPGDLAFCRNEYGKPYLAGPSDFPVVFSLSHTKGLSVCAVTSQQMIGVDVESLQRTNAQSEIAKRYFTSAEAGYLDQFGDGQKQIEFLKLWTLKEAFVKAKGLGLVIPLNSFEIQLASKRPPSISFSDPSSDKTEDWQFLQIHLGRSYILGAALHMPLPKPIGVQYATIQPLIGEGISTRLNPKMDNVWKIDSAEYLQ